MISRLKSAGGIFLILITLALILLYFRRMLLSL
jgi:hypothetical protein